MKQERAFDEEQYTRITEARIKFLKQWLPDLITSQGLKSALDAGCGVGYFSNYLASLGLKVIAFDGRSENVLEAQSRYRDIKFVVHNVEDSAVKELGSSDLTLCFGFLYHLENPFLAVRNLYALTGKVLLVESMVTPSSFPVANLIDEGHSEDQSLNYIALVPSESGLVKLLYRAGFPYVYVSTILPNHEDFHETNELYRKRTILFAAKEPLGLSFLRPIPEPETKNPWLKPSGYQLNRLYTFMQKPWQEKLNTARFRFKSLWFRLIPSIPLPVHLPYGGWWLAVNDVCSNAISTDTFEKAEWRFVEHFLKEGMTVLDVGAHHGFYTILASKKVGTSGRVIAFEPSPKEQKRLSLHVKLNRCRNVKVEPLALAGQDGEATFFAMEGEDTAFSSLRPPAVSKPTQKITVSTSTLDNYIKKEHIDHVDFIKIDAEGAELEILRGAKCLFNQNCCPVIMAEVSDIRTEQWGYQASEIFDHLSERSYRWFVVNSEGKLEPFGEKEPVYNFVAVPERKLTEMKDLIQI